MAFTGQRIFHKDQSGFETTNGTIATAYTFTLSANGVYSIRVSMTAKDTTSGKSIKGIKSTTFERISGTTTQVATSLIDIITTLVSDAVNNAGATWTIDNSGDDIRVRVTGNIGRTIHWLMNIEIDMN
jgi:hypothetical protein